MDRKLVTLADQMRWARLVAAAAADRALAAIAAIERPLPEVCGPCRYWLGWTGQYRECRACRRGRVELTENDRWRAQRERSIWTR